MLTVHDMGSNHHGFIPFFQHPSMAEVSSRVIYVHVDLPGQGDSEANLPESYTFPSMEQLGRELACVLEQLQIKYVVSREKC